MTPINHPLWRPFTRNDSFPKTLLIPYLLICRDFIHFKSLRCNCAAPGLVPEPSTGYSTPKEVWTLEFPTDCVSTWDRLGWPVSTEGKAQTFKRPSLILHLSTEWTACACLFFGGLSFWSPFKNHQQKWHQLKKSVPCSLSRLSQAGRLLWTRICAPVPAGYRPTAHGSMGPWVPGPHGV